MKSQYKNLSRALQRIEKQEINRTHTVQSVDEEEIKTNEVQKKTSSN